MGVPNYSHTDYESELISGNDRLRDQIAELERQVGILRGMLLLSRKHPFHLHKTWTESEINAALLPRKGERSDGNL